MHCYSGFRKQFYGVWGGGIVICQLFRIFSSLVNTISPFQSFVFSLMCGISIKKSLKTWHKEVGYKTSMIYKKQVHNDSHFVMLKFTHWDYFCCSFTEQFISTQHINLISHFFSIYGEFSYAF